MKSSFAFCYSRVSYCIFFFSLFQKVASAWIQIQAKMAFISMFLLLWISCTIQAKHNSQSSNSEMLMGEKYLFSTKFICALDYKNLKYFIHDIFYIENERWVWHLELCFSSPNTHTETTVMIVAVKSTRLEG